MGEAREQVHPAAAPGGPQGTPIGE